MTLTALRDIPFTKEHTALGSNCHHTEALVPFHVDSSNFSDDGTADKLYFQMWSPTLTAPDTKRRVIVLYVHGLGDYSGRFARFVSKFMDEGVYLASYDHIGHGRSSGMHGYVPSMQSLMDGLKCILAYLEEETYADNNVDLYLMGMSMGGLVVTYQALMGDNSRIKGIIAINPLIRVHRASMPNPYLVYIARGLAQVWPTLAVSPANRGQNHPDPEVEREFYEDPGTYSGWLRVGTGMAMKHGLEQIWTSVEKTPLVTPPMLVVYGNADKVTDPQATVEFMKKLPNVEFECLEGGSHVLWSTLEEADEVFTPVFKWIRTQSC